MLATPHNFTLSILLPQQVGETGVPDQEPQISRVLIRLSSRRHSYADCGVSAGRELQTLTQHVIPGLPEHQVLILDTCKKLPRKISPTSSGVIWYVPLTEERAAVAPFTRDYQDRNGSKKPHAGRLTPQFSGRTLRLGAAHVHNAMTRLRRARDAVLRSAATACSALARRLSWTAFVHSLRVRRSQTPDVVGGR